jgi:hypothetical protein
MQLHFASNLHHAQSLADPQDEAQQFLLDAAYIGFFYMLRPGEYLSARNSKPIYLRNITFQSTVPNTGAHAMQALTSPARQIRQATYSAITFDDQKNRMKGETIAHGRTFHHLACPTAALMCRVLHLRANNAAPNTPLLSLSCQGTWRTLKTHNLTQMLKRSAAALPSLNYDSKDVTARSLRHGGAMALLLGGTAKDTMKLVGRWRSEAIFRYLHSQALPLIAPLASTMLQHGVFTLMPGVSRRWQLSAYWKHIHPTMAKRTMWLPLPTKEMSTMSTTPIPTVIRSSTRLNTSCMWRNIHSTHSVNIIHSNSLNLFPNLSDVFPSPFPISILALHNYPVRTEGCGPP